MARVLHVVKRNQADVLEIRRACLMRVRVCRRDPACRPRRTKPSCLPSKVKVGNCLCFYVIYLFE